MELGISALRPDKKTFPGASLCCCTHKITTVTCGDSIYDLAGNFLQCYPHSGGGLCLLGQSN